VGLYAEHVLPRGVAWGMSGPRFRRQRASCFQEVAGRVLEVGFGAGLNLPHYPERVTELLAVEPATVNLKLAAPRVAAAPFPVRFIGRDGGAIPVEDGSIDHVTSTWTLCTIADLPQALSEMRRVLKPDGRLHFLEHGLSPDEDVARWQHRLDRLQAFLFGGCHLDRRIDDIVCAAGFAIDSLERYYMEGPRILSYLYKGRARRD